MYAQGFKAQHEELRAGADDGEVWVSEKGPEDKMAVLLSEKPKKRQEKSDAACIYCRK